MSIAGERYSDVSKDFPEISSPRAQLELKKIARSFSSDGSTYDEEAPQSLSSHDAEQGSLKTSFFTRGAAMGVLEFFSESPSLGNVAAETIVELFEIDARSLKALCGTLPRQSGVKYSCKSHSGSRDLSPRALLPFS